MIRNKAGQVVTANLTNRSDGLPVESGSATVEVLGDGGTKVAGLGEVENEGGGTWSYFPTKAETDFAAVTYSFAHDDAIRVDVQLNPIQSAALVSPTLPENIDGDAAIAALSASIVGPQSASVDGVSVTQHSPSELIAAARFLASQNAVKKPHRGLRFTKLVPPGAS